MEEWKHGTEQNQSNWDDCHGCVSAVPARMPSKVLRDIWKAVHHKIDVCSTALNSRPIRRDVCDIETWTGLSKTARTSTFWWSCGHGRWSGPRSSTCRRWTVVRSDGRSKVQVDGYSGWRSIIITSTMFISLMWYFTMTWGVGSKSD